MKINLQRVSMTLIVHVSLLFANYTSAADEFVFWPDADYDPAIPTIKSVLGHQPGERITWHA